MIATLEFDRPLRTLVGALPLADRQLVEIARALLDEPACSLAGELA